jgi:hypothetical protein
MPRTKKPTPKIKDFSTRKNVREFADQLRFEFAEIGKRLGVTLHFKNITYESDRLHTRLNVTIDGAESLEEKAYNEWKEHFDLPDLGTIIKTSHGDRKIVGLNPRARKNKVLLERNDGKRFVAPIDLVLRLT